MHRGVLFFVNYLTNHSLLLELTNIISCLLYRLRIPSLVPVDVLKTHPNYDAIQRDYQQIVQSIESSERNQQTEGNDDDNDPRTPATVLDFFAGIGSGTVALKRLGIAMKKVNFVLGEGSMHARGQPI
jgi:hypothetical protein